MMRKIALLLFLATCFFYTEGQSIRVNTYGSYAFDDDVDSYYSNSSYFNGTLNGGLVWGAGVEYKVNEKSGFELLYKRLDSQAPMTFATGILTTKTKTFDYGLNYIMIASNRYKLLANGKVEPYGSLTIGMAIFDIKNPEPNGQSSITKFAWGGRGGVNFWIVPKVGIRLQLELISVVQAVGGGAYFGTGGSGANVNSFSSMQQFNIGGGLVFKITEK